jgi:hypothetical protein
VPSLRLDVRTYRQPAPLLFFSQKNASSQKRKRQQALAMLASLFAE